ncbi:MAG: glycosyltransferase family 4 protein [Phycisphaerae bacterium]|nr:glycosyltransferase family 4 protein [Phycisphaerae bacterium]
MADKLNIVFMAQVQYPRGMAATRRIQNFVNYLARDGRFTVRVLVLRGGRVRLADEAISGECGGVPYVTIGANIRPGAGALLKAPKYYWDGIAYLRRHRRADCKNVLYVYEYPSTDNLPMLIYARMAGYRIVFDLVEDIAVQGCAPDVFARIKHFSGRLFCRTLWMFADAVLVISSRLMEKMQAVAKGRFAVVHYPVNIDMGRGLPPKPFGDPVRVFYGGTFGGKDAVETLIEGFERVCGRRDNVRLILTGKGDPHDMDRILERIARSQYRDRILYMGYLDEDAFYGQLAESDILCMTRTASAFAHAGFPFKLGEYLASGRPVIASRVGDVGDYLEDGRDALLVAPDSAGEIAGAIEALIADPDRARRIGEQGRRAAMQHFDAAVLGRKLVELFDTL